MTEYPGGEPLTTAARARLGRRSLLRGAGAALLAGPLLAACGGKGDDTAHADDESDSDRTVAVANRIGFVDKAPLALRGERAPTTVIQFFAGSNGIAVKYHEDINDDEQYFAKAASSYKAGRWTGRDLVVLPSWLAAQAVTEGMAEKFERLNMMQVRNLTRPFQGLIADPQRKYTLPWAAGITGIAYDSEAVRAPVRTVEQLFSEPSLRGKVTALTSMRDTLGLVIAQLGEEPAAATSANVSAALAKVRSAVQKKQFLRFTAGEYIGDLISGRAVASIASSLDMPKLKAARPSIEFVVPEAGGMLWSRDAFVPKGAHHQKNAELLMNDLYGPRLAAKFAAGLQHVCTVEGAREELAEIKPALMSNPLMFPDAALMARLSIFVQVDAKTGAAYTAAYRAAIEA